MAGNGGGEAANAGCALAAGAAGVGSSRQVAAGYEPERGAFRSRQKIQAARRRRQARLCVSARRAGRRAQARQKAGGKENPGSRYGSSNHKRQRSIEGGMSMENGRTENPENYAI